MRPELITPEGEEITPQMMRDMLALVGEEVSAERVGQWAPLERAVVYDWAYREYLRASDCLVRRRLRPSLLGTCCRCCIDNECECEGRSLAAEGSAT